MPLEIQPLPWDALALNRFEREGSFIWLWEPDHLACVLGAGTPEGDVSVERCAADGVPVYRRRGGGGAVVLTPGQVVITACYDAQRKSFATQWIAPIAEAISAAVRSLGVGEARVRGLGDVAVGERKVLGSSLYANRRVALYQGSLLVDAGLSSLERYLPHPSREPEYRRGRPHLDFVTTLAREGYAGGLPPMMAALEQELRKV